MGDCVSTPTQQESSAMKEQVLLDVKPPIINGDLAVKRQRSPSIPVRSSFRDYGSKDETFFDSQAWLDSDCDDDFMSVNGEFTPSRGTTPIHHNFSLGSNKPHVVVYPYQPSPIGSEKKIRLSDLFKDSLRVNYNFEDEQDEVNMNALGHDGEVVTNNGHGLKTKKERFGSCFRTLLYSRSSSTNGRKMMSP